jgi:hypothetical protein
MIGREVTWLLVVSTYRVRDGNGQGGQSAYSVGLAGPGDLNKSPDVGTGAVFAGTSLISFRPGILSKCFRLFEISEIA